MKIFCYALTIIGIILYLVAAIVYGGTTMGEVLSDAGNAVFLFNILVIAYAIWRHVENISQKT